MLAVDYYTSTKGLYIFPSNFRFQLPFFTAPSIRMMFSDNSLQSCPSTIFWVGMTNTAKCEQLGLPFPKCLFLLLSMLNFVTHHLVSQEFLWLFAVSLSFDFSQQILSSPYGQPFLTVFLWRRQQVVLHSSVYVWGIPFWFLHVAIPLDDNHI